MKGQTRKKAPRRLLAWALAAGMALGMLPASALAAESEPPHAHCVCGGTVAAGDHTEHTEEIYTPLSTASLREFNNPASGGYSLSPGSYYLTEDIALDKKIVINDGVVVDLCLNGHKLDANGNDFSAVINKGTLNLCDCKGGGEITRTASGGVDNNGIFTMYGGSIKNNSASAGGGVKNSGTFAMYGGSIVGNVAGDGGGVRNSGIFTMCGGSITRNKASAIGGGVSNKSTGTLSLHGDVNISGNTNNSSVASNVYFPDSGTPLTLADALTGEGKIGVTVATPVDEGVTIAEGSESYAPTDDDAAHFVSDNPDYSVELVDGVIKLGVFPEARYRNAGVQEWTKSDTLNEALDNVANGGEIQLLRDVFGSESRNKNLTIDLNGNRWTAIENEPALGVSEGGEVTLTDSTGGGEIIGGDGIGVGSNKSGFPAVRVDGGTLILAGDKAFTLQGGNGGDSTTSIVGSGGAGVEAETGMLIVTNQNVVCQGGNGGVTTSNAFTITGGRGGDGCTVQKDASCEITGGVFKGGISGGAPSSNKVSSGGIGMVLYGKVNGELTVTEAVGGASYDNNAHNQGYGLSSSSSQPLTIAGGSYQGIAGADIMTSGANHIKGGSYQGKSVGLWIMGSDSESAVTIENITATGGETGLSLQDMDIMLNCTVNSGSFTGGQSGIEIGGYSSVVTLRGGAYTATNERGYAVIVYRGTPVSDMLAAGYAYYDENGVVADTNTDKIGQQTTIAVAEKGETYYAVSGKVTDSGDNAVEGAWVTLKQGNAEYGSTRTNSAGKYVFPIVTPGVYNVVAEQKGKIKTILVIVTEGNREEQDIQLPAEEKSSVVEVKDDTPAVVVGGLHALADDATETNVTIKLTVEKQNTPADKAELEQAAAGQELLFLDLSLVKIVDGGVPDPISEAGAVLEIVIPYELAGKDNVTVYRKHGGEPAKALAKQNTEPRTPVDGQYWLDTENNLIHVYAKKFSTYAIGHGAQNTQGGSSSSSGSTPSYTLSASAGAGGAISPSGKTRVGKNGSKTFAIRPDEGYEIADVLVDGKSVGAVASYTFEKVTAAHTIEARFRAAGSAADGLPFADVQAGDWFYDSVRYVYEHALMNGVEAEAFAPNLSTDRGMIVTILWRMEGAPESGAAMHFRDVAAESYYYEAVRWAAENGVVKGYDAESFGPEDAITREQLAAILYRYSSYKGYDVSAAGDLGRFADAPSDWAREAVSWAVGAGVLSGQPGDLLDPLGSATRAETATVLMRLSLETGK